MPITEAQRAGRRASIGSSDIAAILGMDPFRSAADVWAEKTYELKDLDENRSIALGNRFERSILEQAAEDLAIDVELDDPSLLHLTSPADPLFRCHLDARVLRDGRPAAEALEAKWTALGEKEWGEPGSDQVPKRVIVQVHHQMFCGELELVRPAVLLSRFGRPDVETFRVERNEALIEILVGRAREWWQRHVVAGVPPEGEPPSVDVLKRIRRIPRSVVPCDKELVDEWARLRKKRLDTEKAETRAKAKMLAALGDAEAGEYGDPLKWLTYFEQSSTRLDQTALKFNHPDVYQRCLRSGTSRTPRIQKKR